MYDNSLVFFLENLGHFTVDVMNYLGLCERELKS